MLDRDKKSYISQFIHSNIQHLKKAVNNKDELLVALLRHEIGQQQVIPEHLQQQLAEIISRNISHISTFALVTPNCMHPEITADEYDEARAYAIGDINQVIAQYDEKEKLSLEMKRQTEEALKKQTEILNHEYIQAEGNLVNLIATIKPDEQQSSASSSSDEPLQWWNKYIPIDDRLQILMHNENTQLSTTLRNIVSNVKNLLSELDLNIQINNLIVVRDIYNVLIKIILNPTENNLTRLNQISHPLRLKLNVAESNLFNSINAFNTAIQNSVKLARSRIVSNNMEKILLQTYKQSLYSSPSPVPIVAPATKEDLNLAYQQKLIHTKSPITPSPPNLEYHHEGRVLSNKILSKILTTPEPGISWKMLEERNNNILNIINIIREKLSLTKEPVKDAKWNPRLLIEFLKIFSNAIEEPSMKNIKKLNRVLRDLRGSHLSDKEFEHFHSLTQLAIGETGCQAICGNNAITSQLYLEGITEEEEIINQYIKDSLITQISSSDLQPKMKI